MVEQAYINVLNAKAQYDAAVVQLKASQESYRVANEQFKYGAANLVSCCNRKICMCRHCRHIFRQNIRSIESGSI